MAQRALLLIHGYPFDHTLWDGVIAAIGEGFEVFAPDLRGFGGQPTGADEPALERMADDMKDLLDRRSIARAVVAGMSMGGYVALAFAERYPDRVAGLTLVSSQAAADTEEARANRRAMIQRVRREGPHVAADAISPKVFSPRNAGREELARYPKDGAAKAGAEGIAWALEAMARRPDRTGVLKALTVPVSIVHGLEDQLIPPDRARQLASLPRDAHYVEIPGAGHGTPLEAPAEVAIALKQLVQRCA